MAELKTIWFDKIDRSKPLCEYPRPQLKRDCWQCLNGEYEYSVTEEKAKDMGEGDGIIIVPFAVECSLSGVERTITRNQRLWYRKIFTLDSSLSDKNIILHFGAVDWQCRVFINNMTVGSHVGGYDAFSFDITKYLRDGENELKVSVYDPTDDGWQQRGKQTKKSHGIWYTSTTGIWQTVWLEGVDKTYIKSLKLLPDIDNSRIYIKTQASGSGVRLSAEVSLGGKAIAQKDISADDYIEIPQMKLWSPEEPNLYDLKLELKVKGKITDTVFSYFGMRKFSIDNDAQGIPRLFLNNEPYFQNGLLDQGYWCDGGMTPPCEEAMIYDIQKMKDLGFNMLRKHIKVEPSRWYYHCDRLGMLVWQDMVSGGEYIGNFLAGVLPNLNIKVKDNKYKAFSRENPKWRENFKQELFRILDMLYNHTSICCWVPFNEGWGQFDAKEIGEKVKAFDPSRFVDHASGWYDQGGKDFRSIHRYILPVTMPKKDGRPFVLSEYGGYSYIIGEHVYNKSKSFGYVMYKSEETLTAAYKKLFEKQLIPLIPKGLCAAVYTQVSDVEFEVNGILTYDRKLVKMNEDVLREVNAKMKY